MKHLKSFEKIIPFVDDLGLGFKLSEGMLGILIGNNEYEEMNSALHYLKDKNIKFRLLITNRVLLLLFPNIKDVEKLPLEEGPYTSDLTCHYVPFESTPDPTGRVVGWFFQDIIEEDNWEEVIINHDNDIKELEEKMKILSTSNKYNL